MTSTTAGFNGGEYISDTAAHFRAHLEPVDDPYQPEQIDEQADKAELRAEFLFAQLLDHNGLKAIPPPEPIISGAAYSPGVLFKNTIAWIYGKPGDGKSFVTIDMACSVATGTPWHGRDVAKGIVLYVVAEGASGMSQRVEAWAAHHRVAPDGVVFLPIAIQFGDPTDVKAVQLLSERLKPSMVIIDTQARTTVGMEENSAKDMGVFVDALDTLRAKSGACVVVVHHQGRGSSENLRGSSAIDGAAYTLFKCEKDGRRVTLTMTKQKDGEKEPPWSFQMVNSGESVVLSSQDGVAAFDDLTEGELAVLEIIGSMGGSFGVSWSMLEKTTGLSPSSLHRATKSLVTQMLVSKDQEVRRSPWVITDKGQELITSKASNKLPFTPPLLPSTPPPLGVEGRDGTEGTKPIPVDPYADIPEYTDADVPPEDY